jgi:hypothetical protein
MLFLGTFFFLLRHILAMGAISTVIFTFVLFEKLSDNEFLKNFDARIKNEGR